MRPPGTPVQNRRVPTRLSPSGPRVPSGDECLTLPRVLPPGLRWKESEEEGRDESTGKRQSAERPRRHCQSHFPFGRRGSTVSGRQTRKGLMPVVACANASILVLNRFSQAFFVGKALSLPVSKVQPPEATGSSCHSTHAHSAEADVASARNQSPVRSEAA